ncbi:hypothetical protein [Methylobacterium planeticum]|uniref:Uncharacterized protein n=1 Tax=Methylobacterium planeticum TaxID=2615211 RepID=A0A6N6ME62_9HYPH|nr:hypothetical protein [Methylobacterium planeticum]KAB1068487.1 hypothetical protein F6X51_26885 [Methylobacterium planeticum]
MEDLQTEPKGFVDAEITLQNWPTSFGCRAAPLNDQRALIATNLARDLPDWFSVALAPDFTPRDCTVTWRGQRLIKVALFEEAAL